MKRILIRAKMSPLDNFSVFEILKNNYIGGNSGNMFFLQSVFRTLMVDGTKIDVNYENYEKIDEKYADFINEYYDYFVLPFANAFRTDFIEYINRYTKLIKKIKIPCIVIGINVQTEIDDNLKHSFSFDNDVKRFVSAVLDKSESFGVRGEITAKYLENLGFKNNIDVIGCPSMFLNGDKINVKKKTEKLNKDSIICYNDKLYYKEDVHEFFYKCISKFTNYYYIPQMLEEFRLIYAGVPFYNIVGKNFPNTLSHEIYKNNRVRFFINVKSWIDFLKGVDFTFGTNIHGNISSILSGTPSFVITLDSRTRELAEYHNIPHMWYSEINEQTDIEKIYEKTDFTILEKGHKQRFEHFIKFLERNGLNHIYKNENKEVPLFDLKMDSLNIHKPIESITSVSVDEISYRLENYYNFLKRNKNYIYV